MSAIGYNTNIEYVYDTSVGYYWSYYSTKNAPMANIHVASMMTHVATYLKRVGYDTENPANNGTSNFSKGLRVLASAVFSNTGQHSICAQAAGYYLLGGDRFIYSDRFAPLILD